jgi:competence protein ComEA
MVDPPVPPRPEPRGALPPGSLLERLRDRWDDPRVRIAALLVGALVAGLAWYQLGVSGAAGAGPTSERTAPSSSRAGPGPPATADTSRAGASPASGSTGTSAGGPVVVHVAGAVVHPGVVRLRSGSRVVDAIQAAGGGAPGADLDRLNLAAKLVDGQRIAVALVGAPAPVEAAGGDGTGGGAEPAPGSPINLNTATESQLEELPGIGPSLAAAIVAEREKRGGFKAVGELQDVRGIGELRFAEIKDLVAV